MTHFVYWARHASVPELAEVALEADNILREPHSRGANVLARARKQRRIALDELVRRGAIKSYSFA